MNYKEIKDSYEYLDSEARWEFLFGLFGYKRAENHGFRKFMNGKYSWYRPDGTLIRLLDSVEFPFIEVMKKMSWLQDGVIKKMQDANFTACMMDAIEEYVNNESDESSKFLNPMFYFLLPIKEQVFILFLADKKYNCL